ncbi:MAG TPA: glycosyltransferase family 4 protein [Candidatus Eisenbacteria bacterium]|nr:glycosyltransferase family 4 protein [Candidatus Eisenbacteria bacterium]
MEPLRIAVALPHLGVYGGIRRFLELSRVWTRQGHTVALLTPPAKPGAEPGEPWLPYGGERGGLDRLARERWDVLLSPDPELFLRVDPDAGDALRVLYAVLEKAPRAEEAWRRADVVLANSATMKRHLARRGIRAADGVGGVNLEFFRAPSPDPRPLRTASGAPVRVLVYGRLSRKRKGTLTAAQAVDRAAHFARVPVELTLFDAPPPRSVEEGALPIRVPYRWVIRPTQEELAALYRDTDIFVSAERRAGWCNTAAEAMACGAAVVCTPSGTEDFARRGETALVARWPTRWFLARRILHLLRHPDERIRIAAAGNRAIQAFGWERTAASVESEIRAGIQRKHVAAARTSAANA